MPYTITISCLFILNIALLVLYKKHVKWSVWTGGFVFTLIWGCLQFYYCQNMGNVKMWLFPENEILLLKHGIDLTIFNIDIQDIFFIPIFFNIFYIFKQKIRKLKDFLNNERFLVPFIASMIIIETIIYQCAGDGGEKLIFCFIVFPLLALSMIKFDFMKDFTQEFCLLLFCFIVGFGYDIVGVYWNHWVYIRECNLLGEHGWIYSQHVTPSIQFAISGAVVMYFSTEFFERKLKSRGNKRIN